MKPYSNNLSQRYLSSGNLAKDYVLKQLVRLLETDPHPRILDVGCVGLQPLQFWFEILQLHGEKFSLHGIDVDGIEKAVEIARQNDWGNVHLQKGSAYTLSRQFGENSFHILVATQVLEHLAQWKQFLQESYRVVKPGGHLFLTLDSAHYEKPYPPDHPAKLFKNIIKKILSALGQEKHYEIPLYDRELEGAFQTTGFKILEKRYYNIHPLKEIQNHKIEVETRRQFAEKWASLEDWLNDQGCAQRGLQHYFMDLYYHLQK